MAMYCGLHVGGGAALREVDGARKIGETAEALGYDSIVTGDHITIPKKIDSTYPYVDAAQARGQDPYSVFTSMEWMDAFTVLALLIPVTKTVRLGTSVTIVPYRHPLEMARVVASLDVASGGRMIFGAGVGWMADEFELLGVPYKERAPRTREYIAVMKEVWTNETPRFDGKFVRINRDLHFAPKPTQKPHPPIWVGGESTPALKRVVEFGQGWHIGPLPLSDIQHRFGELRQLMEAGGRDYAELEITSMVDPSVTAAEIRAYRDAGLHGLHVACAAPKPESICHVMRDFKAKMEDALG